LLVKFYWALICFVIVVPAGLFGFGLITDTAHEEARIIFWISLVLLILSMLGAFFQRRMLPMD
jgi:uncharacterized membrane protein YtjA (UPF0391 family)